MKSTMKKWTKPALAGTVALIMTACGKGPAAETADLKVTNGIKLSEDQYPAVVLIVKMVGEAQMMCTATFVNDHQIVTAGHCVEGLSEISPKLVVVQYKNGVANGVRALSFKRNPMYSMRDQNGVNPHDLAVVTFPAGTAPAVATIAAATPAVESPLTIVGYGNNRNFMSPDGQFEGSGAGEKRFGKNVLARNTDGFLTFIGVPESASGVEEGDLVASGSGDSGGPMFVDGKLVGVTSGGGLAHLEDGTTVVVSNYVDLNSEESKAFLQRQLN